jgi:hypothetical protein
MATADIIPLITGPASALGICLLVGLGVYRIVANSLVPMLRAAIDRHLASVDEMSRRHQDQHERIISQLETVDRKLGGVYARLADLKEAQT